MAELSNKIDFVLLVSVKMANPNGENAGNSCAFSPICWDEDGKCVDNVLLSEKIEYPFVRYNQPRRR